MDNTGQRIFHENSNERISYAATRLASSLAGNVK
jgi:hypothetical protein